MALNFPASPSVNQVYTLNNHSWIWNGVTWVSYNVNLTTIPPYVAVFANTGQLTSNASTGNILIGLASTGTSATYGNTLSFPTISVDQYGRVNAASNIALPPSTLLYPNTGQLTANASTGNVLIGLANFGTAGTYGGATGIPNIVVDQYGRISSITNITISNNSILFSNSTGYISNTSNIQFFSSNNNLSIPGSVQISNSGTPNTWLTVLQSNSTSDTTNTYSHSNFTSMQTGNTNAALQAGIQNFANGTSSSSNFVIYNNKGIDASNYLKLGMLSLGYDTTSFPSAYSGDAYLYADSANVVIGAGSSGYNIKFIAAPLSSGLPSAIINGRYTTAISNTTGTLVVNGDIGTSGNILSSGFITGSVIPTSNTISSATNITFNTNIAEFFVHTNSQSVGVLTINAPVGTPVNGQKILFRMSSTTVQTFSWNSVFTGSVDLPLPGTSSGSGLYDYMGFIYNSTANKWQLIAKTFGF